MADSTKETTGSARSNAEAQQLLQEAWVTNIDSQTVQQMTSLGQVRLARINQLQRQAATGTALKGADDPEVAAIQGSILSQQILVANLGVARNQAAVTAPIIPAKGWVVYGYVRDQNLQPVAQLTVFLVNEQKNWLRAYGYAFTDQTGYFNLSYTPAAGARASTTAVLSAFLEVIDQKRQPLYIDSSPFSIGIGTGPYRDVVLSGAGPLGKPPAGADAVPPAAK